jgi:hypothetical protein
MPSSRQFIHAFVVRKKGGKKGKEGKESGLATAFNCNA